MYGISFDEGACSVGVSPPRPYGENRGVALAESLAERLAERLAVGGEAGLAYSAFLLFSVSHR